MIFYQYIGEDLVELEMILSKSSPKMRLVTFSSGKQKSTFLCNSVVDIFEQLSGHFHNGHVLRTHVFNVEYSAGCIGTLRLKTEIHFGELSSVNIQLTESKGKCRDILETYPPSLGTRVVVGIVHFFVQSSIEDTNKT